MSDVAPGLHRVADRGANCYLLEGDDGLILVDTGFPGTEAAILAAVRGLGRAPQDLRHVVATHGHYDHIGSLAAVVAATGAKVWVHTIDAPLVESGGPSRPMTAAPGLLAQVLFRVFFKPGVRVPPAHVDHPFADGDILPLAGGLRVVHAPGHCAGQAALIWGSKGVLFAGDVAMNVAGLGPPIGYEDRARGEATQRRIGLEAFDIACFGHGVPLIGGADVRWRRRWPAAGG